MSLEVKKLLTNFFQQRDKQITSVSVAPYEGDDVFVIPRNRTTEFVAFVPAAVLKLEQSAMISQLANTRMRYERA